MKLNQLKNKQGFTLIELSIVLVIIGVVLAGVFVTASSAMNNNKKQQLMQEAVQVVQNSKNMFSNNSDVASFDTATLINSGSAPAQYITTDGHIKHPFTIDSSKDVIVGGVDVNNYTITFTSIPKDACVQLITNIAGSVDLMNKNVIKGVGVTTAANTGAKVTTFTDLDATTNVPSASLIATKCNHDKNDIGFSFQP